MLDELKNLEYHGGKEGLLYFICDIIGQREIKEHDAEVLCSYVSGQNHLSARELVRYCLALGWIQISNNIISVVPAIVHLIDDKEKLNNTLIISTVKQLFAEHIFKSNMFFYDVVKSCYAFKNELFPLTLSSVRNVLISQGFLISSRDAETTRFYIDPTYDSLVAEYCKESHKQISLEELKKKLEENDIAGEKAELFVLSYEINRVGYPLCTNIKRISEIDVMAGYDIISFESSQSRELDRFIEVKAVSSSGFYWSRNEYEIAKLKGQSYYLYLVELNKIHEPNYLPEIIQNPVANIMEADEDEWFIEAQSYYIGRV